MSDFAELLALLGEKGFDFVVIGGCAVGAYAHLRDETVVSADLDIYTTGDELAEILAWAPGRGIAVRKRPEPRPLPVAVLRWRDLEINILTWAAGLPSYGLVSRVAREFVLPAADPVAVPIADPLDLLANKLKANRDKDRPHIDLLCRFVEDEIAATLPVESGRRRVSLARRYLEVLDRPHLPEGLAATLVSLATEPIDLRFLANTVPNEDLAAEVRRRVHQVGLREPERAEVLSILARRAGATP